MTGDHVMVDSNRTETEDLSSAEDKFLKERASSETSMKDSERKPKKWKLIFIAAGLIVLILVIINSLNEMHKLHNPSIPVITQIENARTSMFFLSLELDSYRQINGGFPDTLDLEMQTYGLEYDLDSDGLYTLAYQSEDTTLVFCSTDDPAELVSEELAVEVFGKGLE